uniref:Polycomb protein esc n=1 Tax=Glossina brevipalpis TaxID=37001 RepID=A0A1A9WA11_9MUSC
MEKNCTEDNAKGEDKENESESASTSTASSSRSISLNASKGRRNRTYSKTKVNRPSYKYNCHLKEDHGQPIYGVTFNHLLGKDQPLIFATVGSNRCSVYQCPQNGGLKLQIVYADPDPNEIFYTCSWSYEEKTGSPLLAAGGYRGIIRVIDVNRSEIVSNCTGHGQAINELKFHPRQPFLLLSGSKDHSIRLWNIQTNVCIAIFGGVEGHRDEVLSIDFNILGERIISGGLDHSLKLWRINTAEFQEKIKLSRTFNINKSHIPFATIMQHYPDFSTRNIHGNYVDCVQWFGDFILSKSCENSIICWKPGQLHENLSQLKPNDASCTIICEFNCNACEIWFVRFDFNPWHKIIALGNQYGKVLIWELDSIDPRHAHSYTLNNIQCTSIIRKTSFSRDANVLVWVCDDATVWRWNRKN